MGKLSPEKEAQLKALEAERDSDDDAEEDSAWVRLGDGREVRLTGARLQRFMVANGFDEADADASSKGAPLDASAGGAAGPAKGKAAPKKATIKAGAVTDDAPEPDDEELEAEPAPKRRGAFF